MKIKNKNYTVEILRFIFAIDIALFHYRFFGFTDTDYFKNGYIGVEFFFIVSGYLMAENGINKASCEIYKENIKFIVHKIKAIFIPCVTMQVIGFILYHITKADVTLKELILDLLSFPYDLLLLRQWGFNFHWYIGVTWYISAMLIAMFVCYPLLLKNKEKYTLYIAPIVTLLILGCFSYRDGKISDTSAYWGIIYKSTLRAFAIINLGVMIYTFTKCLNRFTFTSMAKRILGVIEIISLSIPLFYAFYTTDLNLEFESLFFMSLGIMISFLNITIIDDLAGKMYKLFGKLGKLSMLIFISHCPILYYVLPLVKNYANGFMLLVIYISLVVIMSVLLLVITNAVNKNINKIKSFWIKGIM